jgi:hypothetical protein
MDTIPSSVSFLQQPQWPHVADGAPAASSHIPNDEGWANCIK